MLGFWCFFLRHLRQARLGDAFEIHRAVLDLAVAELVDHFQYLGPGGIEALVDLFVHLDGHAKFELLGGHFAFLGGLAIVGAAAPGPAATLQASLGAAVAAAAAIGAVEIGLLDAQLPPLDSAAPVDHAIAA